MFNTISYFEFIVNEKVFIDRFPSDKTQYVKTKLEGKLFPSITKSGTFMTDLFSFLSSLNEFHFGFHDFFWFIPKKMEYDADELYRYCSSLYFYNDSVTNEVQIRMTSDKNFIQVIHAKETSLPQQSIDCIPIFVTSKNQKFVTLGYKKKSVSVKINFPYHTINVLSVGLYGSILFGEHLEPAEISRMDALNDEFKKTSPIYIELNSHQASPAIRAVYEEGGFKLEKSRAFYIGSDSTPRRDPRYSVFGEYGYDRYSISHMVCVLIAGEPPAVLPHPIDVQECSTAIIVPEEVAVKEFVIGGIYSPAFTSHIRQLRKCLDMI